MNNTVEKLGYVVLLDALGVKSFNMSEAIQFINKRDCILDETNAYFIDLIKKIDNKLPLPQVATFGDSVIFCWNVSNELKYKTIHLIANWLRFFFYSALNNNLFFRGSISFGEFIFDENSHTVLGTAINDAASWFEEANWIGIMTTPSCSFIVETNRELTKSRRIDGYNLDDDFILYPVPLKNGQNMSLNALNWISKIMENESDISALALLLKSFETNIPKGTEYKYFNTLNFLQYIKSNKNYSTQQGIAKSGAERL